MEFGLNLGTFATYTTTGPIVGFFRVGCNNVLGLDISLVGVLGEVLIDQRRKFLGSFEKVYTIKSLVDIVQLPKITQSEHRRRFGRESCLSNNQVGTPKVCIGLIQGNH